MAGRAHQAEGRQRGERNLVDFTKELNTWLSCSAVPEKSSSQRLAAILDDVDASPYARRYKQCEDGHTKFRFLWAVASVIRAVKENGPISARVQAHPGVVDIAHRLEKAFFDFSGEVPPLGIVLTVWHDGRLERYNETLWRAARRVTSRLKDDLEVSLVSALRHAARNRPKVELELQRWPMAGCPLARAFLEFLVQHSGELGDLGRPALSECPPHSLLPTTLRRLLGLLEAFEFEENRAGRASGTVGIVRLRVESAQAVGTKPKAGLPSKAGARGKAMAASRSGTHLAPPLPRPSWAAKAPPPTVPPKATQPKAPARKLVRRRIDWGNDLALRRIVRRGLAARDPDWASSWASFCRVKQISPADASAKVVAGGGSPREKEAVAEFVEQHLVMLLKRDWAKDLLFKTEGQDDELPPDSADDGPPRPIRPSAAPAAGEVAATAKSAGAAAPGADALAASGKRRPPGPSALAAMPAGDAARGSSASGVGVGGVAAASVDGAESCSSGSQSSRSRKRRKLKKKKKYGKYMKGMTPEVMMMNQMMGMSMMMNNPLALAAMGMGASMPGMNMLANAGVKSRKDGLTKRAGERGLKRLGDQKMPLERRAKQLALGSDGAAAGLGSGRQGADTDHAINTDEL